MRSACFEGKDPPAILPDGGFFFGSDFRKLRPLPEIGRVGTGTLPDKPGEIRSVLKAAPFGNFLDAFGA